MKPTKKIIALILCCILILTPIVSLSASAAAAKRDIPMIDVHGFMSGQIYKDKDDPSQGYIWDWSQEEILDLIKKALPIIAKYFFLDDWDGMANAVLPLFLDFFDGCILEPDGSPAGNTAVKFDYPAPGTIKKDSVLSFSYDWRLDPLESAAELNKFIDYVLECSGADQVALTCHSLGGVVTTAYITEYGDEKLRSVCYNTTAIYGETYTGELLSGKMVLTGDAIQYYLEYAFEGMEYEKLLNGIVSVVNGLGLLDFVCDFGNLALEKLSPILLPQIVVPLFAGMPSIWAMVPDEYLDASRDYVFNVIYKDDEIDRSGLIEKLDAYDETVRAHKTETLQKLNDDANLYVFSRYGYSSIPIVPSYTRLTDSVIDTKYSSFGATTAEYGSKLSDADIAGKDPAYISPDRMIDASTCLFPEQTWFFKDFPHSTNAPLDDMIETLLYTDFQATVDTYEEYPRFMQFNRETKTVSPFTPADAAQDVTFLDKVLNFFRVLRERLQTLFDRIKEVVAAFRD